MEASASLCPPPPVPTSSTSTGNRRFKLPGYSITLMGEFPGGVFRGANPLTGNKVGNFNTIKERNITHIVSLLESNDRNITDEHKEINYIHFPIKDKGLPEDESKFNMLINQIINIVNDKDNNVLIHCEKGWGRTGIVVACLFKAKLGLDGIAATQKVREKVRGAIENEKQEIFINNYYFTNVDIEEKEST